MTLPTQREGKMIEEYYKDISKKYISGEYKKPDICIVLGGVSLFILTCKIVITYLS